MFLSNTVGDADVIAAIGLGNTTLNMMGYAFMWGFTNALDTFISRSAGAKKHELSGVYFNRGMFYLALILIPVTVAIFYVENVLLAIGQQASVAAYAQEYLLAQLPGVYLNVLNNALGKLINNYGRTEITLISNIIGLTLNIAANYLFVAKMGLGITGTGYAAICNFVTQSIVTLTVILCTDMR